MSTNSKIEWTEATWNVATGYTRGWGEGWESGKAAAEDRGDDQ